MYSRKNQRDLTRTEKKRLVEAILELKRSGR
ncbi:MAG TPA: tyrosinase family protein, partial [Streptomyces sp.]